ncbi:MAG: hypothetical protein UFB05_04180, partial [[Eubacterium] siraeum]|nr:hypothetical protein [[Eubacterium] siraeum]
VQSLWAYTPGVRAGAECGATAPSPCRGLRPCDPIFKNHIGFSTVRNGISKPSISFILPQ